MNYTITLTKIYLGISFSRYIKDCKGHFFPKDMANDVMLVVKNDETRIYVPMKRYDRISVPPEVHFANMQAAQEIANAKASLVAKSAEKNAKKTK